MDFSEDEIERYARHIVLADVGGPGQQKLKAARVLVIGAGGLGAPVIQYLAAAGVGTLGIVDDDVVSLSNLQRQVIHDTGGGRPAEGRERAGGGRRGSTRMWRSRPMPCASTPANAAALIGAYDLVVDCSDNFATRYAISDECFHAAEAAGHGGGRPVRRLDHDAEALSVGGGRQPNPTYRCLFPEPPPDGLLPTCAQAGILGALTGVIGAMQALEAVKEIVGIGEGLVGRLLLYDARAARLETIAYRWNPSNPLNGTSAAAE